MSNQRYNRKVIVDMMIELKTFFKNVFGEPYSAEVVASESDGDYTEEVIVTANGVTAIHNPAEMVEEYNKYGRMPPVFDLMSRKHLKSVPKVEERDPTPTKAEMDAKNPPPILDDMLAAYYGRGFSCRGISKDYVDRAEHDCFAPMGMSLRKEPRETGQYYTIFTCNVCGERYAEDYVLDALTVTERAIVDILAGEVEEIIGR